MDWDLDFSQESPDQVDQSAGQLLPGFYRARVVAESDDNETGAKKLQFQVANGIHSGKKITEKLTNPKFANDPDAAKTAMQRARIFGVRLGLVAREAKGTTPVNWAAAIGREVVIKVTHRQFKGRDGNMVDYTALDFAGIYPLDHKDIPADVRVQLGLPPLAGGAPAQQGPAAGATTSPAPGTAGAAPLAPTGKSPAEVASGLFS